MKISVIILLALAALGFFVNLYRDFNGVEAKEPGGFWGAVSSLLASAAIIVLYWQAGLFD
jgi:hypothetical protein